MIQIQSVTKRAERLYNQAKASDFIDLACDSCDKHVDIHEWNQGVRGLLAELIEHCVYDHMGRSAVIGLHAPVILVGGYALAASVGAVPQTEREDQWRQATTRHPSSR